MRWLLSGVAVLLTLAAPAHATLISNGDFSTEDFSVHEGRLSILF